MSDALIKYRRLIIAVFQISLFSVVYLLSFLLRLDYYLPDHNRPAFLTTLPLILLIKTAVFYRFGLFRGWWRYVGMNDLADIIKASSVSTVIALAAVYVTRGFLGFPRSVWAIDWVLTIVAMGGVRFAVRAYNESSYASRAGTITLIVGAGEAGSALVRQMKSSSNVEYRPVGFVDDNPAKKGLRFHGLPVLGTTADLPRLIDEHAVEKVLIAVPSLRGAEVSRILDQCRACQVDFKIVPAINDLLNGSLTLNQVREVRIEDLLGREPVSLDIAHIREKLAGRTVLITGAGGSIGSELARQIAGFEPRQMILFERSENDLHSIEIELQERFPLLDLIPVIGDITDDVQLDEVFAQYRPQSVFHAAAYKHVPMMERHLMHAIRNNIFGTASVARAAVKAGVEDFLMISSDKAVNPTSVMGATKRAAELVVAAMQNRGQTWGQNSGSGVTSFGAATRFVSVRFGNVLGSNGSVLPLFRRQIAARQPVTVTHPEVRRYFMTTTEAVQLVLQASTMGRGGEIFVLEMGEPVKIADLARKLIQLSGLEPDRDIEIRFTGLRPGEKLFEELLLDGEGILPTMHDKIRVLGGRPISYAEVSHWLISLNRALERRDERAALESLCRIVPEYTPGSEVLASCEANHYPDRPALRVERSVGS
ncbi:MAG: nucleoside-diphosphate sugar epimerase/dehydratase [Blastocatellia bacterium]